MNRGLNLSGSDLEAQVAFSVTNPQRAADDLRDSKMLPAILASLINQGKLDAASKFFERLITYPASDGHLPVKATDALYLNGMSRLVGDSIVSQIVRANSNILDDKDFDILVDNLYCSNIDYKDYIDRKATEFRRRFDAEYSLFHGLKLEQQFPYKYLTSYSYALGNAVLDPPRRQISVEFIYCIKNRVKRTSLSLKSLDRALGFHLRNGSTDFTVSAIVVEDKSDDILRTTDLGLSNLRVDHYVVDTGVSWTRSGLLNYGVRNSSADILAFVDADFLFHIGYLGGLERALLSTDWRRCVFANNLIETEAHTKSGHIYSSSSPYSYLWMAPRDSVIKVDGFDEGFTGHGFEDRDFELKLTKLGGLTVTDTLSFDGDCFVLHLSHSVRDGIENNRANRERFLERKAAAEADPTVLKQERWGEQKLLTRNTVMPIGGTPRDLRADQGMAEKVSNRAPFSPDVLFVPHNRYHASTAFSMLDTLERRGVSCEVMNISPPHPNEGAPDLGRDMCSISDLLKSDSRPKSIVVFNDWERPVARMLIKHANNAGIQTIGIVEGVNDFNDIDTGKSRTPYKRVKHLILNGEHDKQYFDATMQNLYVGGVQRLDELLTKYSLRDRRERVRERQRFALINVNFTYGVLAEKRDEWLGGAIKACIEAGYAPIISRHRADTGSSLGAPVADRPLYEMFDQVDVVISRFSGVILEALVASQNVIYYNPAIERIEKFKEPLGAYKIATSHAELEAALREFADGERCDPSIFLKVHCAIENFADRGHASNQSTAKTCDIISDILRTQIEPNFERFRASLRSEYLSKSYFAFHVSDTTRLQVLSDLTFGIKAFGRSVHLEKLVSSIFASYPGAKVIVIDDSGDDSLTVPDGAQLVRAPERDIGLSAGRNMLIDLCDTTYFVLLDDDFIFTEKTDIARMLQALKDFDLDIVGGAVYDVGPSAQSKDQPRTFYGSLDFLDGGTLKISTGKVRQWCGNVPLYDLVLNFFVAKTESLSAVKWDAAFKLGEHLDFFIRAKQLGFRITYLNNVLIDHFRDHSANTESYKEYRRRADMFHEKFKQKYSISKIMLNDNEIPG